MQSEFHQLVSEGQCDPKDQRLEPLDSFNDQTGGEWAQDVGNSNDHQQQQQHEEQDQFQQPLLSQIKTTANEQQQQRLIDLQNTLDRLRSTPPLTLSEFVSFNPQKATRASSEGRSARRSTSRESPDRSKAVTNKKVLSYPSHESRMPLPIDTSKLLPPSSTAQATDNISYPQQAPSQLRRRSSSLGASARAATIRARGKEGSGYVMFCGSLIKLTDDTETSHNASLHESTAQPRTPRSTKMSSNCLPSNSSTATTPISSALAPKVRSSTPKNTNSVALARGRTPTRSHRIATTSSDQNIFSSFEETLAFRAITGRSRSGERGRTISEEISGRSNGPPFPIQLNASNQKNKQQIYNKRTSPHQPHRPNVSLVNETNSHTTTDLSPNFPFVDSETTQIRATSIKSEESIVVPALDGSEIRIHFTGGAVGGKGRERWRAQEDTYLPQARTTNPPTLDRVRCSPKRSASVPATKHGERSETPASTSNSIILRNALTPVRSSQHNQSKNSFSNHSFDSLTSKGNGYRTYRSPSKPLPNNVRSAAVNSNVGRYFDGIDEQSMINCFADEGLEVQVETERMRKDREHFLIAQRQFNEDVRNWQKFADSLGRREQEVLCRELEVKRREEHVAQQHKEVLAVMERLRKQEKLNRLTADLTVKARLESVMHHENQPQHPSRLEATDEPLHESLAVVRSATLDDGQMKPGTEPPSEAKTASNEEHDLQRYLNLFGS